MKSFEAIHVFCYPSFFFASLTKAEGATCFYINAFSFGVVRLWAHHSRTVEVLARGEKVLFRYLVTETSNVITRIPALHAVAIASTVRE